MMWRNVFILCAICAASYAIGLFLFQSPPRYEARTLPAFEIKDLNGQIITPDTFKGQIILINFWASWCAPCVKEFPALIQIAKDNPETVTLLALSSDIDEKAIRVFLEKFDLENDVAAPNILIAHDVRDVGSTLFDVHKIPETLIIDQSLVIRDHIIGAAWSMSDLQNKIDRLLSP